MKEEGGGERWGGHEKPVLCFCKLTKNAVIFEILQIFEERSQKTAVTMSAMMYASSNDG